MVEIYSYNSDKWLFSLLIIYHCTFLFITYLVIVSGDHLPLTGNSKCNMTPLGETTSEFCEEKICLEKVCHSMQFFMLTLNMTLILIYEHGLVKKIVHNIWFSWKTVKNRQIFAFSECYLDRNGNFFLEHFIAILVELGKLYNMCEIQLGPVCLSEKYLWNIENFSLKN